MYRPYGFPGHEGIDLQAALGAAVRAVADGVVVGRTTTGNYGNAIRVRHSDGWVTTYAHLRRFAEVEADDVVAAGDVLGYAGSSGNSTGVHLHLTLRREGYTYTAPGGVVWPQNIHDPTPYLEPWLPAAGIDLLPYLRGDGRAYRVGNAQGSSEVFQTQAEGDRFYQVKAWGDLSVVNWEEFIVSDSHIGRDVDTSPGGGRFYRQSLNGSPGAPWVKRRMGISESFSQTKRVQFYRLDNCAAVEQHSGTVTDTITLVEHLSEWRSPFGVVVPDVVVLKWEQGGELYRFGRGYGLVGWSRAHQDPNSPAWSGIAAMRPDVGRLARLRIGCL